MGQKVYKDQYTIIVDPPIKDQRKYTTATFCSFGFDGDNCWIKNLADSDQYIFNDDVSSVLDRFGDVVGDKDAVTKYLLSFIGDSSNDSSMSVEYLDIITIATSLGYNTPSANQQVLHQQLISDLKSNGIWEEDDVFYLPANDGSKEFSSLNWKDPSSNQLTEHGTTIWTSNSGFKTDGATGYFNSHWKPLSDGVKYQSGDGSYALYIKTQADVLSSTIGYVFGSGLNSSSSASVFGYRDSNTSIYWKSDSVTNQLLSTVDFTGVSIISRKEDDASKQELYRDGVSSDTSGGAVIEPISDHDIYFNCVNFGDSGASFCNTEWGFWSAGSNQKDLALIKSNLINAYMDAI